MECPPRSLLFLVSCRVADLAALRSSTDISPIFGGYSPAQLWHANCSTVGRKRYRFSASRLDSLLIMAEPERRCSSPQRRIHADAPRDSGFTPEREHFRRPLTGHCAASRSRFESGSCRFCARDSPPYFLGIRVSRPTHKGFSCYAPVFGV
jgi:hypothetical protein